MKSCVLVLRGLDVCDRVLIKTLLYVFHGKVNFLEIIHPFVYRLVRLLAIQSLKGKIQNVCLISSFSEYITTSLAFFN
jgi:hypothetical protein